MFFQVRFVLEMIRHWPEMSQQCHGRTYSGEALTIYQLSDTMNGYRCFIMDGHQSVWLREEMLIFEMLKRRRLAKPYKLMMRCAECRIVRLKMFWIQYSLFTINCLFYFTMKRRNFTITAGVVCLLLFMRNLVRVQKWRQLMDFPLVLTLV